GEAVAAFALTEPQAGSDVSSVSLRAERDENGWRLSGVKKWISNAPEADVYTVFARTTQDAGSRGLTAFVVPGDSAGLNGTPLELISPHPIGTLEFEGVRGCARQRTRTAPARRPCRSSRRWRSCLRPRPRRR